MINANGTASKPGDWAGSGATGGGVYAQPGQFSSYNSRGSMLNNFQGQMTHNPQGDLSGLYGGNGVTPGYPSINSLFNNMFGSLGGSQQPQSYVTAPRQPTYTTGPIPPALGPQGIPGSQLPQNVVTGAPAQRFPLSTYSGAGPAQFFDLNRYGPSPTGSNTTTIPYNPNGGGYTNINQNNQGNLPGYPGGNGATYGAMGNDFRSSNFSPSSYNPRWQ